MLMIMIYDNQIIIITHKQKEKHGNANGKQFQLT